jgi:antibiotic biosynthesis monooxygenase (ABM) superfamily enzyme
MKIPSIAIIALLLLSPHLAFAQSEQPHTVVHVVTVKWKAGTTPAQIEAALEGVRNLPSKYSGIVHVWTKSIKVQGGKANAFVMEFADAAALKAYTDSPAQKDWYKTYLPIRGESSTFDVTN